MLHNVYTATNKFSLHTLHDDRIKSRMRWCDDFVDELLLTGMSRREAEQHYREWVDTPESTRARVDLSASECAILYLDVIRVRHVRATCLWTLLTFVPVIFVAYLAIG